MLFQDALKMRLDLIRPSKQNVADCLNNHPPELSPGMSTPLNMFVYIGIYRYMCVFIHSVRIHACG